MIGMVSVPPDRAPIFLIRFQIRGGAQSMRAVTTHSSPFTETGGEVELV